MVKELKEINRKQKSASKKRKQLYKIVCFIFILTSIYITGTAISIWNYGKTDEKSQADAVIVLGAGTHEDELTPVFQERINHGIWLYQNKYVKKIILTGGYGEGNQHSDAYVAKNYAVSMGVPKEDILIEEESTITQENLENAKVIMEKESYDTAIIVSDPLHMKRAMQMAEDYEIQAYSSPTPTTRYRSMKNKLTFLAREVFFYVGYQVYRLF